MRTGLQQWPTLGPARRPCGAPKLAGSVWDEHLEAIGVYVGFSSLSWWLREPPERHSAVVSGLSGARVLKGATGKGDAEREGMGMRGEGGLSCSAWIPSA